MRNTPASQIFSIACRRLCVDARDTLADVREILAALRTAGDEALHASALKYGGRFALVLPTWDWHRGLLKLPAPLRGGRRAIEERKMLEVARKYVLIYQLI